MSQARVTWELLVYFLLFQKALAMRMRMVYKVNDQDKMEQGQINNFPPGLWARCLVPEGCAIVFSFIFYFREGILLFFPFHFSCFRVSLDNLGIFDCSHIMYRKWQWYNMGKVRYEKHASRQFAPLFFCRVAELIHSSWAGIVVRMKCSICTWYVAGRYFRRHESFSLWEFWAWLVKLSVLLCNWHQWFHVPANCVTRGLKRDGSGQIIFIQIPFCIQIHPYVMGQELNI